MSAFKVAVLAATLLWLAAVGYGTYSNYQQTISRTEPVADSPGTYRLKGSKPAESQTLTSADILKHSLINALIYTVPLWLFTLALLGAIRFANRDQDVAKS